MVSNFRNTARSVDIPSTIGNTQECMVSLYMNKVNLFLGDMCVNCVISNEVAILKSAQPYLLRPTGCNNEMAIVDYR